MAKILRKCTKCGEYTLRKDSCPYCGSPVKNPHPPRFSPHDPYGSYRRKLRRELLKQE
ncbi:MAG: RNA-protein complex protein Nop10 [Candidatus Baldrarchaeia archaeon]